MTKRALICGIGGQDGAYLTELLLGKDYEVYGLLGPEPGGFREWAEGLDGTVVGIEGDVTDTESLVQAVAEAQPEEVYNFAALSSVIGSWERAVTVADVNAVGVVRLLEAIRAEKPDARFCQASSAELFDITAEAPQSESTPVNPSTPYGASKAYAHFITADYRATHGLHASSAILFNHESPRRPLQFVSRKISDGAARIKLGLADELLLGSLDVQRDWGFAGDYVEAMWLMLQRDTPDDYVVATGEAHTVRDFCETAFARVGLDYEDFVRVDPGFVRPAEVQLRVGDARKARERLGWVPRVSFAQLVNMMVDADVEGMAEGMS